MLLCKGQNLGKIVQLLWIESLKNLVPTKNFAGSRRSLGKVLTLEEDKVALGLS